MLRSTFKSYLLVRFLMKWIILAALVAFVTFAWYCFSQKDKFTIADLHRNLFQLSKVSQRDRYMMYVGLGAQKPVKSFQFTDSNVDKRLVREFLFAAQMAAIAYYTTVENIATALSYFNVKFLGYRFNESCQAFAAMTSSGQQILSIRGTEFTEEHHNLWEVWDDIKATPLAVKPHGAYVHSGFYQEIAALWPYISPFLNLEQPIWVIGHSLGGVRAHLARAFIPHTTAVRITTFGGPKGANYDFWDANMKYNTVVERVVAERDFAPDYPWMVWYQPTEMFYWMTQGQINHVDERDYVNLSLSDHRLSSSYLPLLANLVDTLPEP